MNKRGDLAYLQDIVDAAAHINDFLTGLSFQRFLQERLYQSAVLRELEIIGEASRSLSDELRERYPSVPWADIIGMRNRIAHAYFAVRMRVIWETVTNDLPVFQKQVEGILADLGSRDR